MYEIIEGLKKSRKGKFVNIIAAVTMSFLIVAVSCAFSYGTQKNDLQPANVWVIKAGDRDLAVVKTQAEAEQIALGLKISYLGTLEAQQEAKIYPLISYECRTVGAGAPVRTVSPQEAVQQIREANMSSDPPVKVVYKKTVEENKVVAYKKKKIKTARLDNGETKVKRRGKTGSRYQMTSLVNVNGETDKNVIVSQVTEDPVKELILQGTNTTDIEKGEAVIKYAEKFLGNPYVWGGEDLEKGVDCSGYTMMVYRHFGISLPHSSSAQGKCGDEVKSLDKARAGDLIVYKGHVAFYMGDGRIIHAAGKSLGIIISDNAGYSNIKTIRRIFGSSIDTSTNEAFVDYMDKVEGADD